MADEPPRVAHPSFMGIPTYPRAPLAETLSELRQWEADVAVIVAPVDVGVVIRPDARF